MVDDAADERTAAVVAEAAQRYPELTIQYVAAAGNSSGASRSRNIGFAHTHGDIVFFLDDDDLWAPSHVHLLCEALDSVSDFAVAGLSKIDSTGKVMQTYVPPNPIDVQDVVAHSIIALTGSNFAIRRPAFESVQGFNERFSMFNDADFFARCLLSGLRVATSPEPTAIWRKHEGGQLTDKSARRAQSYQQLFDEYGYLLNLDQRREQQRHIYRMRQRYSRGAARWWWAARKLLLTRPSDIRSRGRQRPIVNASPHEQR